MKSEIEELFELAKKAAILAGNHTLHYFGTSIEVVRKGDDSPVTIADKEAELLIRKEIESRFPDHGIIGEEFGIHNPNARVKWIIDPIDGTQSFIHGVPLYTTLIGITIDELPSIGVIYAPVTKECCAAANGLGTWFNDSKASVRACSSLSEATFLSNEQRFVDEVGLTKAYQGLLQSTRLHRTWCDGYGHMMVATGRADIMFDPILNIWDAAALLPVLKEAGGAFYSISGEETIYAGNGISSHPSLLPSIIAHFE